jgi:hypothetical protein
LKRTHRRWDRRAPNRAAFVWKEMLMGADLLMSWLWTTTPDKVDFDKARALIREELSVVPDVPDAEFWKRWDPNGDFEDSEIIKDGLLADTDQIAALWNGEYQRDAFRTTIGPIEILMTGGMSWGDSPSEFFDVLNRWGNSEAARAAGFFV